MFAQVLDNRATQEFADDVRRHLSKTPQRELYSKYLYDDIGSALFEVITLLPEYGLTRADERLLHLNASAIVAHMPTATIVAELGSGSGKKARWILEAMAGRGGVTYYPIDVSISALHACHNELGAIGAVHIEEVPAGYLDGLEMVVSRRIPGQSLLVLFLGSTIGNFERGLAQDFLRQMRSLLLPGDALLLGCDLVKPIPQLLAAYDDSIGATAAFSLNILARINRELEGNFQLHNFRHEARYNVSERRIEMHLRSEVEQTVNIPLADFRFTLRRGETIWTESSHKFGLEEIRQMALNTGFVCEEQWVDSEWPFAESLFRVKSS